MSQIVRVTPTSRDGVDFSVAPTHQRRLMVARPGKRGKVISHHITFAPKSAPSAFYARIPIGA